jgi:hypothetical protein
MIKIKCDYSGGAVAIPTEVIDKHLKLAPVASFKVLLFILRNPDGATDPEQISACTGLSVCDVADSIEYWEYHGVISVDDEVDESKRLCAIGNLKSRDDCECEKEPAPKKVNVKSLPVKKPTQREIAMRMNEEPQLTTIYTEAQTILGTFGYDTQALILMIYDYYGFPPEVIITLLQHQKCEGNTSSVAIKNRAEDWAKRGIDSLELVEEELLALDKISETFEAVKENLGSANQKLTARVSKFLRQCAVDWECSPELIKYALEESNKALTDAGKLLKKWSAQGLTNPAEVEAKQKKSLPKEVKKSYDTEKVGKSSVLDWAMRYADKEENE